MARCYGQAHLRRCGGAGAAPTGIAKRSVAGPGDTWDGIRFIKGPSPAPDPKEALRLSGEAKLRAVVGLTQAEIDALL